MEYIKRPKSKNGKSETTRKTEKAPYNTGKVMRFWKWSENVRTKAKVDKQSYVKLSSSIQQRSINIIKRQPT